MSQQSLPGGPRTDHLGNQIVHVRDNSGNTLEELFNPANYQKLGSGWQNRNLPPSFFNPPTQSSGHSRENSLDATQVNQIPQHKQHQQVNHQRSRSSPAQLPNHPAPLSLAQPALPVVHHIKQHSMGGTLDGRPDIARTNGGFAGPAFAFQNAPQNYNPSKPLTATGGALSYAGAEIMQALLSPLPQGWEMSLTQDGEIYFINHLDRSTTWFLPNMPQELQTKGKPIRINQLTPQQQQVIQSLLQQQQQQQQQVSPAAVTKPAVQQGNSYQNTDQVMHELQQLQLEREKLKMQQDEINRREMLLIQKAAIPPQHPQQAHVATNSSGMDPFMGQTQENHARQSSTDSGLGGMAPTYTLPRTPDDFLSNVDEIDNSSERTGMNQKSNSTKALSQDSDLNMNVLHNDLGLDMMDTTELPPIDMANGDPLMHIPDLNLENVSNLTTAWL